MKDASFLHHWKPPGSTGGQLGHAGLAHLGVPRAWRPMLQLGLLCFHLCAVQMTVFVQYWTIRGGQGVRAPRAPLATRPEDARLSPGSSKKPQLGMAFAAPLRKQPGSRPSSQRETWGHRHCTGKSGGLREVLGTDAKGGCSPSPVAPGAQTGHGQSQARVLRWPVAGFSHGSSSPGLTV